MPTQLIENYFNLVWKYQGKLHCIINKALPKKKNNNFTGFFVNSVKAIYYFVLYTTANFYNETLLYYVKMLSIQKHIRIEIIIKIIIIGISYSHTHSYICNI